jgi:hypothetical protein
MRSLATLLSISLIALVGCATSAPDDVEDPFDATLGAADSGGPSVREVAAGDHLELSIPKGVVVPLHIKGAPVAVVEHRLAGFIDPYLLVKDLDRTTLTQASTQTIVPGLETSDAIVGVDRDDVITFVTSDGLLTTGTVSVEIVPLVEPLPATIEGGVAQTLSIDFRRLEPARVDAVAKGYLTEQDDGTLGISTLLIPLDQRATIRALGENLVKARQLFVREVGGDMTDYATIRAAFE